MNISLQIDELVLADLPVPVSQASLVQDAIETALMHLLVTNGLAHRLTACGTVSAVLAPRVALKARATPTAIGEQIARSVFEGISR